MIRNPVLRLTGIGDLVNGFKYARAVSVVEELMRPDRAGVERFRERRLREIVRHAYENVEVYHRRWRQAGVHPDDIRTPGDLAKLPVITKDDLRQSPLSDILSRTMKARDCYLLSTSGSSGTPTRFYVDENRAMVDCALSLPKYMAGMPAVGTVSVIRDFLWRRHVTFMAIVVPQEYPFHQMFWTMKHTVVDSLKPPDVHIRAINTKKPRYITSYPSVIRNICVAASEKGIAMHQPQLIFVAGEVVDSHLRSMVKRTFGTDLMDVYGTTELGYVASECTRHEGMHIFDWKVILELLGEDGREVPGGRTGRVVITDLFSMATPIIRYGGLADYAVRKEGPCSCGSSLPLLARLEGRVVDTVVLPDGQMVHPYNLTLALEDTPCLSKFQIRQEQPDHLRVLLVKDKTPEAKSVSFAREGNIGQKIFERFDHILRHQVKIDLVTVEDIPVRPGSRKYATVVSLVKRAGAPASAEGSGHHSANVPDGEVLHDVPG